ncbi:MAG: nucleotidyltransferase domain-containing protein [Lachnospiraceae bacterium]
MDLSNCIEKIKASKLPHRYKKKLIKDLEQIAKENIQGILAIVLFGSAARNDLRIGSDLDILILTNKTVEQSVRGSLASDLEEEVDGVSTDLIFYTYEDFKASTCILVQQIKADGIVLWEEGI